MEIDCIFCSIYAGKIPTEFLYSDDKCIVIRDINPVARIHLLVIPTNHIEYMNDSPDMVKMVVRDLFSAAITVSESEGVAETGYRLIINQKEDGGQEVPHLHMHLLGGELLGAVD